MAWTRLCDPQALPCLPAHVLKSTLQPVPSWYHLVEAWSFSEDSFQFLSLSLPSSLISPVFLSLRNHGCAVQQLLFCKCGHQNTRWVTATNNKEKTLLGSHSTPHLTLGLTRGHFQACWRAWAGQILS